MTGGARAIAALPVWALLAGAACAGTAEEAWKALVGPKFSKRPEFAFVRNDPALPNVLIYGDSISIGYTQQVRARLEGKANVYRVYCNGGDSGSFISKMTKMHEVMRDGKLAGRWSFEWDVIHFNVGLHDLKYVVKGKLDRKNGKQVRSKEDYAKNIGSIVSYLKRLAPGAKLVFATTTPVPEGEPGRVAGDARRYNETALEVLRDHPRIAVNDLYAFTRPNQSKWWVRPGNVHYGPEGRKAQGDEVARAILKALGREDAAGKGAASGPASGEDGPRR
ncbi:MAG: SGNH/GDSL hydrolase family protein [Planctomycetota bacterium]